MISDPVTLASAVVLTGTPTVVAGSTQPIARGVVLALWTTYTRDGLSATGRLGLRVEVSPDTSGGSWYALPVFSSPSFSAGAMDLYPASAQHAPTAAGASLQVWPEIPLRNARRFRVLAYDIDGAAPGTLTLLRANYAELT